MVQLLFHQDIIGNEGVICEVAPTIAEAIAAALGMKAMSEGKGLDVQSIQEYARAVA